MTVVRHGRGLSADVYAGEYGDASGFERLCVAARQENNAQFLKRVKPERILEVGCGPLLLSAQRDIKALAFRHWAIVEPAAIYVESARKALVDDSRFVIVQGYMESSRAPLIDIAPEGYDAAVISSVIHETADPLSLLQSVRECLRDGAQAIVGVPNALSFHRLLAHEAGLIGSPFELSETNRRYQQPIVYDTDTLVALVNLADFKVTNFGGSLFKPFTSSQMQSLTSEVGESLDKALINLGKSFPRNAAEIYVIAEAC